MEWYFALRPRLIVIIPFLLIMGVVFIYHFPLGFFYLIDFYWGFFSGFQIWYVFLMFIAIPFSLAFAVGPYGISLAFPIALLPTIWDSEIWVGVKIVLFSVVFTTAMVLGGLNLKLNLWLIGLFGNPRLSLWWIDLWEVSTPIPAIY